MQASKGLSSGEIMRRRNAIIDKILKVVGFLFVGGLLGYVLTGFIC